MCVTAHLCCGYLAQVGRVSGDFLHVIQESRHDRLEGGGGLGQCAQDINGGLADLLVWGAEAAQQGWHHWEAEHNTGVPRQCFCCTYNNVFYNLQMKDYPVKRINRRCHHRIKPQVSHHTNDGSVTI